MKIELNDKFMFRAALVLFCFILIVGFKFFYNQNQKLENQYQVNKKLLESYAKEKDSIIKSKNKEIQDLLNVNAQKQKIINKAFVVIDSLQKEKDRIRIVYKKRKGDIEELTNVELENYWKNEIK
jgi:hypothetical protein